MCAHAELFGQADKWGFRTPKRGGGLGESVGASANSISTTTNSGARRESGQVSLHLAEQVEKISLVRLGTLSHSESHGAAAVVRDIQTAWFCIGWHALGTASGCQNILKVHREMLRAARADNPRLKKLVGAWHGSWSTGWAKRSQTGAYMCRRYTCFIANVNILVSFGKNCAVAVERNAPGGRHRKGDIDNRGRANSIPVRKNSPIRETLYVFLGLDGDK